MGKETVFLTGASGSMGGCAFNELLKQKDRFNIVLLLRPSKKNVKAFKEYVGDTKPPVGKKSTTHHKGIKIVWGDLTSYEDVEKCVEGSDYVLHPGALISPEADHKPRTVWAINYGGTKNIIRAIKSQPNANSIKFVFIGSVAMYGDRLPPVHKIRVGDPIYPSVFDYYCLSKIAAERTVIESGLRYWVSIRQTYICIPDTMALMDPIMFHQPLNQAFEMITKFDAGLGLVKTIDAPDEFWRHIYNMGGGPSCRTDFYTYMDRVFRLIGCGSPEQVFDRDWFGLKNFHCGFFEDSHVLNEYLDYWNDTLEDHYQQIKDASPWYFSLSKYVPKKVIKLGMKLSLNPLKWMKNKEKYPNRLKVFFGSYEDWKNIPDWDKPIPNKQDKGYLLDHGYEKNEDDKYSIEDLQGAAKFRGGKCLSEKNEGFYKKVKWECAFGHKFEGSPALILMGGHWCPYCAPPDWEYGKIAKKNPFFAQVYYHNHDPKDINIYKFEDCLAETDIKENEKSPYIIDMGEYIEQVRKEPPRES